MAAQEEGLPYHLMQLYASWKEAELDDLVSSFPVQ
jgi:hypothetical protein